MGPRPDPLRVRPVRVGPQVVHFFHRKEALSPVVIHRDGVHQVADDADVDLREGDARADEVDRVRPVAGLGAGVGLVDVVRRVRHRAMVRDRGEEELRAQRRHARELAHAEKAVDAPGAKLAGPRLLDRFITRKTGWTVVFWCRAAGTLVAGCLGCSYSNMRALTRQNHVQKIVTTQARKSTSCTGFLRKKH